MIHLHLECASVTANIMLNIVLNSHFCGPPSPLHCVFRCMGQICPSLYAQGLAKYPIQNRCLICVGQTNEREWIHDYMHGLPARAGPSASSPRTSSLSLSTEWKIPSYNIPLCPNPATFMLWLPHRRLHVLFTPVKPSSLLLLLAQDLEHSKNSVYALFHHPSPSPLHYHCFQGSQHLGFHQSQDGGRVC